MKCPKCSFTEIRKNGFRRGKQCYQCRHCGRQFVESPKIQPDPKQIKKLCLKMYVNGMGLRGIEREIAGGIIPPATLSRVTEIDHTTIIHWIREAQNGTA